MVIFSSLNYKYFLSAFCLILVYVVLYFIVLNINNGYFSYALDDPYIHLSMAKNFYEKQILSVDGISFASASSSPLWFIMLSFFMGFDTEITQNLPFLFNIIFQILSLFMIIFIFNKHFKVQISYLLLLIFAVFAPFIPLALGGMEHSLQIFLMLVVLNEYLNFINHKYNKNFLFLCLFSALLVATRYENIAFVLMLAITLVFEKKYKEFIILSFISFVPIVAFGIFSQQFNLGFFPSSIMIKSEIGNHIDVNLFKKIINKIISGFTHKHIFIIFILNLYIFIRTFLKRDYKITYLAFVFIGTTLAHLAFGSLGWLNRYEAYLIVFGLLNIISFLYKYYNLYKIENKLKTMIFLFLFIVFFIISASFKGHYIAVLGTKNIFEQQIQMAKFLKRYFNNSKIAANDIGAISFFTNIKLLDLAGLGSYDIVRLYKDGKYNANTIKKLIAKNDVDLIVVYDVWFSKLNFSFNDENYSFMGSWQIIDNKVCGSDIVSFYSKKATFSQNFTKFKDYEAQLPKDVIIRNFNDL